MVRGTWREVRGEVASQEGRKVPVIVAVLVHADARGASTDDKRVVGQHRAGLGPPRWVSDLRADAPTQVTVGSPVRDHCGVVG